MEDYLRELFKPLTLRERRMVCFRFGFVGSEYNFEEIGQKFDVTRERAKQIVQKALNKMKKVLDNKDFSAII